MPFKMLFLPLGGLNQMFVALGNPAVFL